MEMFPPVNHRTLHTLMQIISYVMEILCHYFSPIGPARIPSYFKTDLAALWADLLDLAALWAESHSHTPTRHYVHVSLWETPLHLLRTQYKQYSLMYKFIFYESSCLSFTFFFTWQWFSWSSPHSLFHHRMEFAQSEKMKEQHFCYYLKHYYSAFPPNQDP